MPALAFRHSLKPVCLLTCINLVRASASARQCQTRFSAAAQSHQQPYRRHLAVATMAGRKPIVTQPTAPQTGTCIFLHGLGDTGDGWADVAAMFSPALPSVKFVFPTAPTRPITLNMGMQMPGWFDLTSLEDIDNREDESGLMESMQTVEDLVKQEQAAGTEKVVVAGFSQGGAIALLLLRSQLKLAGVAGLSTWLPLAEQPEILSEINKGVPVWMGHGTADPVVKFEYGERSAQKLRQAGLDVKFMSVRGMGHSATPDELNEFQIWLSSIFSG